MTTQNRPPFALVIAGSESSGGAGIQVDLKTFHQQGVYGMGSLTCIVSFDPENGWAHRFVPIDPQVIAEQIQAAAAIHDVDTVKIGMLGTVPTIEAVAESLQKHEWKHVVLDPVLICKGQDAGAAYDVDQALKAQILPLATVVTPNLFETQALSGMTVTNEEELIEAAKKIGELGPKYVVAKGGVELPGEEAVDILWDGEKVTRFARPKVGEERVGGAGCTLAAAITAELAKGAAIEDAVEAAKNIVTAGIEKRIESHHPHASLWQRGVMEG